MVYHVGFQSLLSSLIFFETNCKLRLREGDDGSIPLMGLHNGAQMINRVLPEGSAVRDFIEVGSMLAAGL